MKNLNAFISNAVSAILMIKNVKVIPVLTGMIAVPVCTVAPDAQQSIRF